MFEPVFTLEEISQHLRVPIDVLHQEISSGHLRAMSFGGHFRVAEPDLNEFKQQAKSASQDGRPTETSALDDFLQIQPAPAFKHKWPDGSEEEFGNAREGVARYMGRDYQVKIGFAIRKAAGKDRVRGLVLVDRYPTVEFAGEDAEVGGKGRIASVIKDRNRKNVPVGAEMPPEYLKFPLGPYREVVDGPGAANGMAVICASDDFQTMARHALIRYGYSEARALSK